MAEEYPARYGSRQNAEGSRDCGLENPPGVNAPSVRGGCPRTFAHSIHLRVRLACKAKTVETSSVV